MIKRIKERRLHLLVIAFLVGLFSGINVSNISSASESAHKYLDYFHQVYQIVKSDYVEPTENKDLFYGAIRGIIKSLKDPYSRFLDETASAALKEETTGKFVGVGIEITLRNGEIVVISPIDGTPAMRAGIISEDVITKINDVVIRDKDLSQIVKLIRGLPHTNVKLTIRRKGFSEPLEFDVERVPIKIKTVSHGILKEFNEIGYLKVKLFSSDTPREIEKALKYFNENNINRLIVDLRWNPGGLLDKAIKTIDLFLDRGKIIVSTRGREGTGNVSEFKSQSKPLYKGEVLVLVNKGSASASEIFSGAIRDNKRGELLGEKTFGKGSVQKFFTLDEDIGVTVTISKYYTPSGTSIHGKGIIPDYKVPMNKIPKSDKENINKIFKDRLLEEFIKTHKVYNDENREKLMQYLKDKNMKISKDSASFIFKRELYKFSKSPLYDLEFDNQLNEAIRIISKKPL